MNGDPTILAHDWWTIIGMVIQGGIIFAIPLMLAGNGELIVERSGIVNIGIEGMMLMGAFTGALIAAACEMGASGPTTYGPWLGALGAASVGAATAALFGLFTVRFKVDQIVAGLAINILALGATGVLYRELRGHFPIKMIRSGGMAKHEIPGSSYLPDVLRHALEQPMLTYVAIAIVLATSFLIARTRWGIAVRAVGEAPEALDTAGLSVGWTRFVCVVVGGALAGLGGGYLSLASNQGFLERMTGGRGFMALALVIFAKWRPLWLLPATVLFGVLTQTQFIVQALAPESVDMNIYYPLILAIPYMLTLLVLAGFIGRSQAPAMLGRPYVR
jgi:simple sugar transport system permease protein